MYCLKCGTDTKNDGVFCEDCLAVMKRFPVKPGSPIQLYARPESAQKKAPSRKKQLSPEEQVMRLRQFVRVLSIGLTATLLALGLTASILLHTLQQEAGTQEHGGKNYTTIGDETTP